MNPDQNKAVLAAVFAETAKGNGRPFIDALAEDVQWTIIGTTPWSKTYVGKGSVINELLRPLGEQLGGASVITASKFIAEGDFVVVQATGHNATVRGERYENTYCWIIRMHEGKMRELTEYADTQLIESVLRDPHSSK
jgi:ketosteroid isomerase-like protein